jgi:hypothetical protein
VIKAIARRFIDAHRSKFKQGEFNRHNKTSSNG